MTYRFDKHCVQCGLPVRFVRLDNQEGWAWVHVATLGEVLARAITLGVPLQHSVLRLSRLKTQKEASIG